MRGGLLAVALWSALLFSASVWAQPAMLLTEDRLAREAVFIGAVVNNRHIHQAIFPDIKFTCPGNVSKWAVVAIPVLGGSRYPALHVWRRGSSARDFVRYARSKLSSASPNPISRVYEVIENPPLAVESGDFFGVFNPSVPILSFRYQQDGAAVNYYTLGDPNGRNTFDLDASLYVVHRGNDYPLVSVEVDPPECALGFLNYSTLARKASLLTGTSSNLEYDGAIQRVIPALEFPASGLIYNITIGASWDTNEDDIPEIQLWRSTGQGTWRKLIGVSNNADITPNIALNVHRYTPFTPLEVQAGDVLGFYQPPTGSSQFRIYMIPGGPDNYVQSSSRGPLDTISQDNRQSALPLITVNFSTSLTPATDNPGSDKTETSSNTISIVSPDNPGSDRTERSSTDEIQSIANTAVIIFATVLSAMIALVLVGVAISGFVYWFTRRNKRLRAYSRAAPHRYDLTTHVGPQRHPPPTASSNSSQMEYNVNYIPKNPSEVIINGRKKTVDLVSNSAYGKDSTSLATPAEGTTTSLTVGPPVAMPTYEAVNPLSDNMYEDTS